METFAVTAKGIWARRNKFIFEAVFIHPSTIAKQAEKSIEEFKDAQQCSRNYNAVNPQVDTSWNPPPSGYVKINWDAALNKNKGLAGYGLVARDHEGRVLATKILSKASLYDPELAKAQGAFHAAKLATELGCRAVILEGDSSQVVKGLQKQLDRWDRVGMILEDTRQLLSSLPSWCVRFVRRFCNGFAHNLARASLELEGNVSELVLNPVCNVFDLVVNPES